jgi:hypothetical protein
LVVFFVFLLCMVFARPSVLVAFRLHAIVLANAALEHAIPHLLPVSSEQTTVELQRDQSSYKEISRVTNPSRVTSNRVPNTVELHKT